MGFFTGNYNKPGPGVDRDEPRKKGFLRFFEVLSRDFGGLVKLNLLFCLCCLPSFALFALGFLGIAGNASILLMILSIAAAAPAGGAMSASFFCITKMLRDDPGFVGYDFKRKFKENFFTSMPAGILCAVVFYAEIYLLLMVTSQARGAVGGDPLMLAINLIGVVLVLMVVPYIFTQAPYFFLSPMQLLKNSLILAFVNAPRSIAGAIQGALVWAALALFFPASILLFPLILLIGFTFSWLLTLMWVWKPVDEYFKIEETLKTEPR